jgi:hypothetical protein
MSEDRKEQLYVMLFDVLGELTEYESPELIFDRIVEDFAASAEYHMGQADTFKSMLDTFRHDNPVETVPDTVPTEVEDLFGGVDDINLHYMLEDQDKLMDFIRTANFSDTL